MNADLEKTLDELGADARAVVARLKSFREIEPSARRRPLAIGFAVRRVGYLVAASLFAAIAFLILFQEAPHPNRAQFSATNVYTVAYATSEEALEFIVASQRADGSWANDFLTRQNAAALRASPDTRMRIAYRRALRYLRNKGLEPLTDSELRSRGEYAAKTMASL